MLAFFLLILGAASLLYKLIGITKSGNKKFGKAREQNKENRNASKAYVALLIVILIGLIFFINWLGKFKYE
ncbi:MAG TPA: hypothetical protein VF487_08455 [Chitinophagaceae bacterium]